MRIKVKENVERGYYKGFIYQRYADELGIDYHPICPDTGKTTGRTMQICLDFSSFELQDLSKTIKEMLTAQNIETDESGKVEKILNEEEFKEVEKKFEDKFTGGKEGYLHSVKASDTLQFFKEEFDNAVNNARMDQDCINEEAVIQAGWKGYKKGIEKALEIVKNRTVFFFSNYFTKRYLLQELKQTELFLLKEESIQATPADPNALIL